MFLRAGKFGVFRIAILFIACVTCMVPPVVAQNPTNGEMDSSNAASFKPLERWSQAVMTGDRMKLATFYIAGRPAFAATPEGRKADPAAEESEFWSSLASKGLIAITPKILEQTFPQGAVKLMLRIELTFHSGSRDDHELVSGEQIWIKQDGDWRIVITRRNDSEPLVSYRLIEPDKPNPHLYPDVHDAQKDIDAALKTAEEDHKDILVIFGANWCYPCQVLDATVQSKEVAPLVAAKYRIVHVNVGDGDSNADLAERYKVSTAQGIPQLVMLGTDGKLTLPHPKLEFSSEMSIKDLLTLLGLKTQ